MDDEQNTPRLTASRDDRPLSATRERKSRAGRRRKPQDGPVLTEHSDNRSGFSRPWLWLLVVLMAGAAYGWWDRQRQAELDARLQAEVQAAKDLAQRELELLRGSLSATGETLSASEAQTGDRLALLESEVRKLWDVSNKRNKGWIQDNEQALESLNKSVSALQASAGEAADQRSATGRKFKELENTVAGLRSKNRELAAQNRERALALQTSVDQVSAQLGQLSASVRSLETRLDKVEASQEADSQSIASINAFRRQTMQSLATLQSAVSNLQRDVEQMRQPY